MTRAQAQTIDRLRDANPRVTVRIVGFDHADGSITVYCRGAHGHQYRRVGRDGRHYPDCMAAHAAAA